MFPAKGTFTIVQIQATQAIALVLNYTWMPPMTYFAINNANDLFIFLDKWQLSLFATELEAILYHKQYNGTQAWTCEFSHVSVVHYPLNHAGRGSDDARTIKYPQLYYKTCNFKQREIVGLQSKILYKWFLLTKEHRFWP